MYKETRKAVPSKPKKNIHDPNWRKKELKRLGNAATANQLNYPKGRRNAKTRRYTDLTEKRAQRRASTIRNMTEDGFKKAKAVCNRDSSYFDPLTGKCHARKFNSTILNKCIDDNKFYNYKTNRCVKCLCTRPPKGFVDQTEDQPQIDESG
jgi:hypothetical protein